jgi:protein phosphatase
MTNKGIREKNDDRIAVGGKVISDGAFDGESADTVLGVVCDGVGGYAYGDEAAEKTTQLFASLKIDSSDRTIIETTISDANKAVLEIQTHDNSKRDMATTIAGLFLKGDSFIAFNVGDSKIFRFRSGYLMQLSEDHTFAQQEVQMGSVKDISEVKEKDRHIITRCIGDKRNCVPSITEGEGRVFSEDVYLLCSDGLTDVVSIGDIEKELGNQSELSTKCGNLIQAALQNGSKDNISVILMEVS